MTKEEDLVIVERVLGGDVNAFETLVLSYEKNVYNLALRMVKNAEDASDMTQEAFVRAYSSLASFRGESKFSVWLYRIVSNVCLDFLRSRSRHPTVSLSVENDDGEEDELDIADTSLSPEEVLERRLTCESVRRGLDALSEEYRQILLLREIQGLSYEEIAQVLSMELGTVKSRIFRARKKLCDFLVRDGNIPAVRSSDNSEGR